MKKVKILIYSNMTKGKVVRVSLGKKSITMEFDSWSSDADNIKWAKEAFEMKYGVKQWMNSLEENDDTPPKSSFIDE